MQVWDVNVFQVGSGCNIASLKYYCMLWMILYLIQRILVLMGAHDGPGDEGESRESYEGRWGESRKMNEFSGSWRHPSFSNLWTEVFLNFKFVFSLSSSCSKN